MNSKIKRWLQLILLPICLLTITGCKATKNQLPSQAQKNIDSVLKNDHKTNDQQKTIDSNYFDKKTYNYLASLEYKNGQSAVLEVNQGNSTLAMNQWKKNKVIYGSLDSLNRTTYVTAFIDKKNLGRSEGRDRQVWQPTGWHQKRVDGKAIYNRGHLLAYTSSFNFDINGNYKKGEDGSLDNPKNLATQSAFSNQKVQTYYETMVRKAQQRMGNKVIFQIVTVFRGNELMPRGYWLQAKDQMGTLNFNVYEFNVEPNVVFDYTTGKSRIDRSMHVFFERQNQKYRN
ncbi:DNA/RNA non-specific endonuclease [Melissococcus plutonius]|uniref:DNA-entry nuclease, competence-specific nuclease n=1 Tax=Melissococcus plutonius TaxID=33970 RepID=A0A2Z5Y4K3_9ENTE|nr:DNA/RNA non-specific endonuclease [Melissococcus plutonius]BAL62975.1 DNA-entry nuclease [Melissococcus plutonius DAT561]MCV2498928.1 DNA/RNA non-specific endonuclease [Melissococcus plutonius]MCV2501816.1 DNA/RNA non-specific endonuclease [Melissococcus plutonius]MCV2505376.1 DNA/RNA non-specific endonuclease [Melissococcus plutonius]MCV2507797.1 DNA/RNA non-specific endonuclease [Melissococcus plutonius]